MSAWEEEFLREQICYFPKHEGEIWYDVVQRDRSYVRWLLENMEFVLDDLRDALLWGVDHVPDSI